MTDIFSFRLSDEFINKYEDQEVPWGFKDAGENSLGEVTFIRTYSRIKEDGTKERWHEVCRRVIEGMYSIQKDWAKSNRLPWNDRKAQASAQEAYDRMFNLKWTPPGRGLWMMGAPLVMEKKNSAALQNCAFASTRDIDRNDPGALFGWVMDALMLGVGVGFDTLGQDKDLEIYAPEGEINAYEIPDTREGWVESVRLLLNSYLRQNQQPIEFDYSLIRAAGEPIRGFGGTSSGPGPLIKLHNDLRKVIGGRAGEKIDSRAIVDIVNLIGTCVVSGNVRRSATLSLGLPQDEDFINLKNAEVFPERNSFDPENPGWAWMSNNSIAAEVGTNYEQYVDLIADNGEPGFIWLDVTRNWGRTVDPKDGKDFRVMGFNPCLTGDSMLMTKNGWIRFDEAYDNGKPNDIVVDGRVRYEGEGEEKPENWKINQGVLYDPKIMKASEVFLTQKNADIVKVETSSGYSVRLTPDHLVMTKNGMVEAGKLKNGDRIFITRGFLPDEEIGEPETLEEKEAVLMGLIAGDGTFTKNITKRDSVHIDLWGKDKWIAQNVVDWISDIQEANEFNIVSNSNRPFSYPNVVYIEKRNKINIKSTFLAEHLKKKYGFSAESKHNVPKVFLTNAVSKPAKFYVAALAFCDGTINKYNKVGSSSARINQSNKKMLSDIQLILLANGIASSVYSRRPAQYREMPNGKGEKSLYFTKENFELVIMANAYEYSRYIGFLGGDKQKLAEQVFNKSRKQSAYATVISVTPDGKEDVYCLKENERRILCANGITMRRCAEQPLESFELCTLVEVHLNRHEDKADFMRTLKFAYLYGKTVTLLSTHWQQTNAIMQRNRRIGTSLTGIASFADSRGLPELRDWMDEGYQKIRHYDNKYSEWLCVRESIRVTTVKPSGSVSILSGATPGVHWTPGGKYFMRAIRFSNTDPMLHLFKAAGYLIEDDLVSQNTSVVYFPVSSEHERSEKDVTLFEKIGLAATTQKYWSDNGVSVTLSFDKETETKHVAPALHMYEGQLKAVSFLPMGNHTYPQQPYTQITQEEYEAYIGKIKKIDFAAIYDGVDNLEAQGEKFCSNDVCAI